MLVDGYVIIGNVQIKESVEYFKINGLLSIAAPSR